MVAGPRGPHFTERRPSIAPKGGTHDGTKSSRVSRGNRTPRRRAAKSDKAQTAPPIGGGYKNVIPIPVDDTTTKTIAGALFKPSGAGPFPGVVFMTGCGGLNEGVETAMEKTVIDHLLAKGVATLLVDPFTPRNEPEGICARICPTCVSNKISLPPPVLKVVITWVEYAAGTVNAIVATAVERKNSRIFTIPFLWSFSNPTPLSGNGF